MCTVYQVEAAQVRHKSICLVISNCYVYDFNVYVGEWVLFLFRISGLSIAMLQGRILVLMTWLLLMMMFLVWQMMMVMTVMKMMMVNEFYISVTGLMELKIMIL